MKSNVASWIFAPALTVVAVACGGKTAQSTPAPAAAADFPKVLSHAICSNLGPCCAGDDRPYTEKSCDDTLAKSFGAKLDDLTESYDQATAQTCLNAIADAVGRCDFSPASVEACNEVTSSAVHAKQGEPCSLTCSRTAGFQSCSTQPVLTTTVETATMGRCFTNDGLYCDADGKCAPQHALGSACTWSAECKDGACLLMGICAPRPGEGGDCSFVDSCADGLICDGSKCTKPKSDGDACETSDQCASGSCYQGTCGRNEEILDLGCLP